MKIKLLWPALLLVFAMLSMNLSAQFANQAFYTRDAKGAITSYDFPALPYAYNALEPAIDSLTMSIHYDRHHRAYYTKFLTLVKESKLEGQSLEDIFSSVSNYPEALRNNAGGYYNHTLYWENMSPKGGGKPSGELAAAIDRKFGSFEKFKEAYANAAKGKFGSGWAWLILDSERELKITSTANQDNPLMDVAGQKGTPLLALDVWEHAYYLKYQNKRADYVEAFWSVVNWNEVERRYAQAVTK